MKTKSKDKNRYALGSRVLEYLERQTYMWNSNVNHLCTDCKTIFKQHKSKDKSLCPNCRKELTFLGIFARVPRKNASDSKWRTFFNRNHIEI